MAKPAMGETFSQATASSHSSKRNSPAAVGLLPGYASGRPGVADAAACAARRTAAG